RPGSVRGLLAGKTAAVTAVVEATRDHRSCSRKIEDKMNKTIVAVLGLILVAASAAFAQGDPPGRVGRLSYVEGTASFHNGDQDQWSPATINYPVIAGQSYWTE